MFLTPLLRHLDLLCFLIKCVWFDNYLQQFRFLHFRAGNGQVCKPARVRVCVHVWCVCVRASRYRARLPGAGSHIPPDYLSLVRPTSGLDQCEQAGVAYHSTV